MVDMKLPRDFVAGFATAAAQIEGNIHADGRLDSIWDEFCRIPGKIKDGSSTETVTDSYNLWKEDIEILKEYGAKAYRFSISWSRVIPKGGRDDEVNPKGIEFYQRFVDELVANDIEPFITLNHWDLPAELHHRYGGWLNLEESSADFERFARVMFDALGSKCKYWLTFNEPWIIAAFGYNVGCFAPGRTSDRKLSPEGDSARECWIVAHSLIISHAKAVKAYREEYKGKSPDGKGVIGITLNGDWCEPYDDSELNKAAAQRALEFWIGWFADPIYLTGDYPACMREQLGDRLPNFTAEQKKLVLGSSDFYGMNTYTTNLVKHKEGPVDPNDFTGHVETTFAGPDGSKALGTQAESTWLQDVPWGFRKLLNWVYKRYKLAIYVTENGFSAKGEETLEQALEDTDRLNYYKGYLQALLEARNLDGVDVRGYFAWSLIDNFEWASGLTQRFGVTYVDFKTQKRTPKASGRYVADFFKKNIAS